MSLDWQQILRPINWVPPTHSSNGPRTDGVSLTGPWSGAGLRESLIRR